jgi:hypothetical protein
LLYKGLIAMKNSRQVKRIMDRVDFHGV